MRAERPFTLGFNVRCCTTTKGNGMKKISPIIALIRKLELDQYRKGR